MKKKILTAFLSIFFIVAILNLNNVFGIGIIGQAYKKIENNRYCLIFREFTSPYTSTLELYHDTNSTDYVEDGAWQYKGPDGKYYTSKWVTTKDLAYAPPGELQFRTIGYYFHTEQMGNYDSKGENYIGYNNSLVEIGEEISSIEKSYRESEAKYTNPITVKDYNKVTFFELMRATVKYRVVNWGTGLTVSSFIPTNYTGYKYAIVGIKDKTGKIIANVYVDENIIYEENLIKIIEALKAVKKTSQCYISNIVTSTAYTKGDIEVSRTVEDFFNQYEMEYNDSKKGPLQWSNNTKGLTEGSKALGSVANLYDNILKFPQLSKRSVMVRHINIGSNNTISTDIVKNGTRIKSNDVNITASNPDAIVPGSMYTGTSYPDYKNSEYYPNKFDMEQSISKSSLEDTTTYKCIGSNVAVASSWDTAMSNIETKIENRTKTGANYITEPGNNMMSDADYIVIDFYYSEYEKDVHVNHLYVDPDGYVKELAKQVIVPNETATMSGSQINRTNTNKYISETYAKKMGKDIIVRNADSLDGNSSVKYLGYEKLTAKTDAKNVVGKQKTSQDLYTADRATINGNTEQINFYYQIENIVEYPEPEKTIEGSVFVKGKNTSTSTTCSDKEQLDLNQAVATLPSGENATIGVQDIPKYMVAAITTEYVSPRENINMASIIATFKMANLTKTVSFTNVLFRAGYYKVTDMALYKLNKVTINDAGSSGTVGSSIFDWNSKTVEPKNMDVSVVFTGVHENIPILDVDGIYNYVKYTFEDKNGNEFKDRTYLTTDQLKEVDANGDNIIDKEDKTKADQDVATSKSALDNANTTQTIKQTAYENAQKEEKRLKDIYEQATEELAKLKVIYDQAVTDKGNKNTSINSIKKDIAGLETSLESLDGDLTTLQNNKTKKIEAKQAAEKALAIATTRKEELYQIYTDSINERNELEAKANCNDAIDQEGYINEEQKQAAEQCKANKEAYQQNLKNQVVEKALRNYNNYVQNEWNNADKAVSDAETEYINIVSAIEEKNKEISNKNTELSSKKTLLAATERDYNTFMTNTYTPAESNYNSYKTNEYATAEKNYNDYIDGKYVKKAEEELDSAKKAVEEAQKKNATAKAYRDNLYKKYDEYKALYDEFMQIYNAKTEADVADILNLNLNISVQDMTVKIVTNDGEGKLSSEEITDAASNSIKFKVKDLLDNPGNEIYQVTTRKVANRKYIKNKNVYSQIGSTLLKETDYNNSNKVTATTTNGVRALAGKVEYTAIDVLGENTLSTMKDNVYYSDQSDDDKTVVFDLKTTKLEKTYSVKTSAKNDEAKYEQTKPVNIYTPITVSAELAKNKIVNQISNKDLNISAIQINTPFTINLKNNVSPTEYNKLTNTDKYSMGYYVKFDFDVYNVKLNGLTYNSGDRIPKGTWIGLIRENGDTTITAQAYGNLESNEQGIISEENSKYTVRAVAYNATTSIINKSLKYNTITEIKNGELKSAVKNLCTTPTYFAQIQKNVVIVNRTYDFRVTDVKDLNWKSVFRYTTTTNKNRHKGITYYSGTQKWDTTSKQNNGIINRTSSEIGRNPLRVLPVGPYKNTDATYIKAPKMGYRFSFDMKVTGSYYNNRGEVKEEKKVDITTKFYYIPKNGDRAKYLPESDGNSKGIYLFYKTSNGKYVRIDSNEEGGYELWFTPNDGYRYIEDVQKGTLSTTSVKLGNLRKITLKHNMATVSNNGAVITYYGEYKLPNSTIAVEVDRYGNYDINKPLKDGYIGVVFDIQAYSGKISTGTKTTDVMLSYSKNTNGDNTSQWDYEGFLGFTKTGSIITDSNPVTLKLEKGTWQIDNTTYNDIKGTVMLYDLDEKAATDYE